MQGLDVEKRKLDGSKTLSGDLAQHILKHYPDGKIAVVTDRPTILMSSVRKQWLKIVRRIARERSSTLNSRKSELDELLLRLQGLSFTATLPIHDPQADVCFATVEQFLQAPPICGSLYITCDAARHEQYMLAAWMPPGGCVIIYGN